MATSQLNNAITTDEKSFQKMRMAIIIQEAIKRFEEKMASTFQNNSQEFFESAMRLSLIFGEESVIDALSISENGLVRVVRDENNLFPFLYEVRSSSFCAYSYYIYDGVNFCKCNQFTDDVIHREGAFVCPHLLAVTFSKACGLMKPDRVESSLVMEAILNSISTPSVEYDPEHGVLGLNKKPKYADDNKIADMDGFESEPEEL